jgi:hypothetical protein
VIEVHTVRRFGRLLFPFALAALSLPAAASGQAPYKVPQDNRFVGQAGAAPDDNAQNLPTLLGNLLRIDTVPDYSIPDARPTTEVSVADTRPPRLFTKTKRRQRVLRLGGVVAYARCPGEACDVSITARVRIGELSYPLKRVRRGLPAKKRVRLKARLTRRARRFLRKALHDGKRAKVDVVIRARDKAGNRTTVRRVTVRARHQRGQTP